MSIAIAYGISTGANELHKKRVKEIQEAEALAGYAPPMPGQQLPELELTGQNKIDWLSHPRTQEMFKTLGEEVTKCESLARDIANSSFDALKTNVRLMEQSLVRAQTLRDVIVKFSKHKHS